jgi:hypothetical protein
MADTFATAELERVLELKEHPQIIPLLNNIYLVEVDVNHSSNERHIVEHASREYKLQQYIQRRHKWSLETLHAIYWDAYIKLHKSLETNARVFVTKLSHGWLPTRAHEAKLDPTLDYKCSCCSVKTKEHMWQCEAQRAKRCHLLSAIDPHLTKQHTNKGLHKEILNCVTNWANRRNHVNPRTVQQIAKRIHFSKLWTS